MTTAFLMKLGQTLIGLFFVIFGIFNIAGFRGIASFLKEKNYPIPAFIGGIGIAWQLVFGLMIVFNWYHQLAALMLIPFDIVAVLIFHQYWKFKEDIRFLNRIIFVSNFTVLLGALFLLLNLPQPIQHLSDLFVV